jgi:hypothetical protein
MPAIRTAGFQPNSRSSVQKFIQISDVVKGSSISTPIYSIPTSKAIATFAWAKKEADRIDPLTEPQ